MNRGRRNRIAVALLVVVGLMMGPAAAGALWATGPWHAGGRIVPVDWYGGEGLCTAGFQAYLPDGSVGLFTAGHCFIDADGGGRYEGRWSDRWAPGDVVHSNVADISMVHLGGQGTAAASGHVVVNGSLVKVNGFQREVYAGQTLCWNGATTGASCGQVAAQVPQHRNFGPPGVVRMFTINITWGPWNRLGNSGEPVFDPNYTLMAGISPGSSPGVLWMYPIDAIETAFGLPVGSLRPVT